MQPLTDRVLVEVDPPKSKTASGLLISEEWKTLPPFGKVKAIGPNVKQVKVGDRIVFERYASIKVDDNLRLCIEANIMGIINE